MNYVLLMFFCTSSVLLSGTANLTRVDFDTSLGKNDPYFKKYYRTCLSELDNKESFWTIVGTAPFPIRRLMTLCKQLYQKHPLPEKSTCEQTSRIPKVIHQIWLGSPLPDKYKEWQKTWQSLPGWSYKLWTDADAEKLTFQGKDLYYQSKNYGQRADILRMAILEKEGGVYVDIDFECLDASFFSMLNSTYDFYTGLHPLDAETLALENALIGCIPGHPVIKAYLNELPHAWQQPCVFLDAKAEVVIKTGPGLFTRVFMEHGGKEHKDIVLPPTYLYPLGLQQWDFLKRFGYESIKRKVVQPETVAIHWWHGTWKGPSAKVTSS
jgi:mannosyltransferase OCH1-like enzyme